MKLKKRAKEKIEDAVIVETKSVKEQVEKVKEEIWRLEENELRQLLDLQNCDETSLLESRLIAYSDSDQKLGGQTCAKFLSSLSPIRCFFFSHL